MFRKVKYILIALCVICISNGTAQVTKLTDIIPPVKLIAGKPDTVVISDLFYLNDYNITVIGNKVVNAVFDKTKLTLAIISNPDFEGITTIDFIYQGSNYSIPVYCKKLQKRTFTFKPEKKYKFISLFGSFNNWNRQDLPMVDTKQNGNYEATIQLEPGRYEYKFFADGEEILDPKNPETVPNGIGGINSVINVANPHAQKIFLHKLSCKKNGAFTKFQFYLELEKSFKPGEVNPIVFLDNQYVKKENISVQGRKITVKIPDEEITTARMLRAVVSIKGLNSNMQMIPLSNGKPAEGKSFSWYDGIIYSLMIDRFNNGDKSNDAPIKNDSVSWKANYMGGDFAGITQKISEGYFDSLGVNTLWISPVVDNPDEAFKESPVPHRWYTGYHGYWPISANKVEEKFGTFDELKSLVNTAHKHNMKVLLDFVSHHVHQEHPYFKEHRDWFGKLELPDGRLNLRLWDEQRLTTWFEPYLPSFDFVHSKEAVDTMSGNAVWWLNNTGADGFRHDAVKHVPNIFWRSLTKKLKKEIEVPTGKDVYQIGETFGNYDLVSSYVNNGQLSAQFNFEMYNTAQAVFIDPKRSFKDLDIEMNKTLDVYGSLHLMGNIMDSHDKNRFMAYTDGAIDLSQWSAIEEGWNNPPEVKNPYSYKKAELYLAYMLTVPGLPVIYYGSEFGMTGLSDPDNRRMMRFGSQLNANEKNMLNVVRAVVKAREENPALRYGDFYTLRADDKFYAFIRSDFNERVLVVLNKSDEAQNITLNLPSVYAVSKAINLADDSKQRIFNNKLKVELSPRGWKMFILN